MADFWKDAEYARKEYVGAPVTDAMIDAAQTALGYQLPQVYIELLRSQNGGIPYRTNHQTTQSTSWADNHVAITGIYGIDPDKSSSICGTTGSKFWIQEWGYPDIGVYFADCPSAGHDMMCLDYRQCGANGEPQVVHVDQEFDYRVVVVAENIEAFIRGLEPDDAFEIS